MWKKTLPFLVMGSLLSSNGLAMMNEGEAKTLIENVATASESSKLLEPATSCEMRPSTEIVSNALSKHYSINLMWINKAKDVHPDSLFPARKAEDEHFLEHIVGWAQKNPCAPVNVWYDSEVSGQNVLEYTIKEIRQKDPSLANLFFKDVRDLDKVKKNPKNFQAKYPVYFRADVLRMIASVNEIASEGIVNAVYSDLDVPPLSESEVFNPDTVRKLDAFGLVLSARNKGDMPGILHENSFQILSRKNKNMLKAINGAFIERNIRSPDEEREIQLQKSGQLAFMDYEPMFAYFLYLEGLTELKVREDGLWRPYEPETDDITKLMGAKLNLKGNGPFTKSDIVFAVRGEMTPRQQKVTGEMTKDILLIPIVKIQRPAPGGAYDQPYDQFIKYQ